MIGSFARGLALFLAFAALARTASGAAEQRTEFCGIRLLGPETISFTGTEKKWLCGDPDTRAWRDVPRNQQKLWLISFLQSRGYQRPVFGEENGTLVVETGKQYAVEKFSVDGAPAEWDWTRRRHASGTLLTPGALDADIQWAKRSLQCAGFPCPEVTGDADPETGQIHLKADAGPKQRFGTIHFPGASDLDPRLFERFDAFHEGDFFDIRLLELTSDRVLAEDLYFSTFYDIICGKDRQVELVRRFVPAPPRTLTFGAGFDTENGPLVRGRWERTRLTGKADSLESTAFLSFRDLQADVKYRNHFPADPSSRTELDPRILVDRRDERQLKSMEYLAELPVATSWELRKSRLSLSSGPSISRTDTLFSLLSVPPRVDALRLRTEIGWTSHLFEYYAGDPREGYNLSLSTWSEAGRWLGDKTIHKVRIQQEFLWNLGRYDPPSVVLGWRGWAGVYLYNPRQLLTNEVPPSERFFLGGDDDLRGFGRQKLQGQGIGYLTAIYEGLEVRFAGWLPYKIQPFLLLDAARAGLATETISTPLYWSPGLGVRWSSPLGSLRGSLARGFATRQLAEDPDPDLQFFVSFGKEF